MSTPDGRSAPETAGQAAREALRNRLIRAAGEIKNCRSVTALCGPCETQIGDVLAAADAYAQAAIAAAAPAADDAPIVLRMDAPDPEVPYEATLIPERVDVAAAPAPAGEGGVPAVNVLRVAMEAHEPEDGSVQWYVDEHCIDVDAAEFWAVAAAALGQPQAALDLARAETAAIQAAAANTARELAELRDADIPFLPLDEP